MSQLIQKLNSFHNNSNDGADSSNNADTSFDSQSSDGFLPMDLATPVGGANASSFAAGPSGSDAEIAFISGIDSTGHVTGTSYWTWNGSTPAGYNSTSQVHKWGSTTIGTSGGTVTYFFDAASNWTATEQAALVSGLALWSAECNISFSLAASAGAANFTFIRGSDGGAHENNSVVGSSIGSSTSNNPTGTFISIDTSVAGFGPIGGSFDQYGGYTYQTLVHEEGHLIGLGHGGAYNGNVTSSTQQFSNYDYRLWSIMSYIDTFDTSAKYYSSYTVPGASWGNNSSGYYYEPTTPMILDILAAQRIYGSPTSGPLTTAQTFGFHTTITGAIKNYFDFTVNQHPVITIFDTANGNTLDLSGFTSGSIFNLNYDSFCSCNGMTDNIGIGDGVRIAYAIGGVGNDVFIINPLLVQTFTGGGGNDTFRGSKSGFGGDTITDLSAGDTINITDGSLSTFVASRIGTSFFYGALTPAQLINFTGSPAIHFVETADATNGGIDLTFKAGAQVSDFNGSSVSDILLENSTTGQIGTWEMALNAPTWASFSTEAAGWHAAGNGDFNGDGVSDVLLENSATGAIGTWEITNNTPTWAYFSSEASCWHDAGVGDFNGDGRSDVLLENSTTGAIGTWEITNNTPTWAYFSSEASGWHVAGVGDFNGDGRSDVLLENSTTGAIGTWEITNNTPTWAYFSSEASGWHAAGAGDFNGDGRSDVLLENSTTGAIGAWEITNNTPTWVYFSSEASGWHVTSVGDYNADGKSDILLSNTSTGQVGEWLISNNIPTWQGISTMAAGWHAVS